MRIIQENLTGTIIIKIITSNTKMFNYEVNKGNIPNTDIQFII